MTTAHQVVTFRLGDDYFAADIFSVERVLRYRAPTPVPNVPDWVTGVMEYHGRILPVVDLRRRFGLAPLEARPETRILVLSAGEEWIGAIVDAVLEVASLGPGELSAPPEIFRGLSAEFLRGILRRGERLVLVLDVPNLLSAKDRLALEAATAEAAAPAETIRDV
jgi:purine-binding chemotaxis protein CheW